MSDTDRESPAGAAAPAIPAVTGLAPGERRRLLRRNNALQITTNLAWYVAAPFIPLYLVAQGASVGVVGAVIGTSGILPLLVSIQAGALVDARGPAAVAVASAVLFAAAGAVLVLLHGVWPVAIAYTLMGIGNIGFAVAPQAVVAAASTAETRIRDYSYYALWNSAGAVAGPIIGGVIAGRYGYPTAFALVGLLMLPSVAIAAALGSAAPAARQAAPAGSVYALAGTILRQRGFGVIMFISAMMVSAQSLQQSFYPLYLHDIGLSPTLIGFVIAAISLASMGVRSLLAGGVSWLGYGRPLLVATGAAALAFGIVPFVHGFWPLVAVSGLMGASVGFTQPLTMSLTVDAVAPEFWGVAFGIRQCVQRLAAVVSPIVFGMMSRGYGIRSALWLGALVLAAAVPIMAAVTRAVRRPPE